MAALWRQIVRGTRMKPELCDYMCGHEGKTGTSARYGKRKVPVLAKEMALFPRFKVPALNRSPTPHRCLRRTRAQITADESIKAARRAAGTTRQVRSYPELTTPAAHAPSESGDAFAHYVPAWPSSKILIPCTA